MPRFVLAPGSIARLRVLQHAGIDPEVLVSGVDETIDEGLGTAAVVGLLAERSYQAIRNVRRSPPFATGAPPFSIPQKA